jgi:hypothetical protein
MEEDLDPEERRRCFERLDNYAKAYHGYFMSEFFRRRDDDVYLACFRPLDGSPNNPNRFACKYMEFEFAELRGLASPSSPTATIYDKLDLRLQKA